MRLFASGIALALIAICGNKAAGATAPSPYVYAEPAVLTAKAKTLAEGELARLAAAEMLYKNKVYYHFYDPGFNTAPVRTCLKLYRCFTGYEVLDIERTDSILRPLKITIRYEFDRVGTREIKLDFRDLEIEKRVKADNALIVHEKDSLVREYFCNAQGEVFEIPAPYLERPNIFLKPGAKPDPYGVWVEDPDLPSPRGL